MKKNAPLCEQTFHSERGGIWPLAANVRLQPNGRYVHAGGYVDRVLDTVGFRVEHRRPVDLRMELGKPVAGWLVTARKPDAA